MPPVLIAFDDIELADLIPVPMLIVSHDPRELGASAARMLFDRLDSPRDDRAVLVQELPVSIRRPVEGWRSEPRTLGA